MSKSDKHYAHLANKPYERPCATCGATKRDENGHDPCIPDLPGVIHACCGHGKKDGYVAFEDGTVLRGKFDRTDPKAKAEWVKGQRIWGTL